MVSFAVKTTKQLTVLLAERVMGWTVGSGRFLAGERQWMPSWRFQPEKNLRDAFRLLEEAKPERYAMGCEKGGEFWVRVEIAGVVGKARHASKPKAITFAVAWALGIDVEVNG
jgi:ABA sandwich protein